MATPEFPPQDDKPGMDLESFLSHVLGGVIEPVPEPVELAPYQLLRRFQEEQHDALQRNGLLEIAEDWHLAQGVIMQGKSKDYIKNPNQWVEDRTYRAYLALRPKYDPKGVSDRKLRPGITVLPHLVFTGLNREGKEVNLIMPLAKEEEGHVFEVDQIDPHQLDDAHMLLGNVRIAEGRLPGLRQDCSAINNI